MYKSKATGHVSSRTLTQLFIDSHRKDQSSIEEFIKRTHVDPLLVVCRAAISEDKLCGRFTVQDGSGRTIKQYLEDQGISTAHLAW